MRNVHSPISGNILIVDDSPLNIRLLGNVLVKRGHKVRPAASGEAALETIQEEKPDLVLLDIFMPGMDGYQVCRKLKAQPETKDIPVIFLSVASELEDKVLAFQAGGVDFITRPIQPEEVIVRVETHLRLHAAEDALRESQKRLSAIFEASPDPMTVTRMSDGSFLQVNRAFTEAIGYDLAEIAGIPSKELRNFVNQDDRSRMIAQLEQHGRVEQQEIQFRRKDGSTFWGALSAVRLDLDEEQCVLAINRDITDRKKAEEALRGKTHELGERVKELNCLYGISKIMEKRDIALDEALQGVVDLIPPSWQYPDATCARITLDDHEFKTENFVESRVVARQSADIMVHGRIGGVVEVGYLEERVEGDEGPFLNDERRLIGEIAERLGTIVERVRAEEALNRSYHRLNQIIQFLPDPTFVIDDQGRVTAWNRGMAQLTGVPSESIVGKGDYEYALPFFERRQPLLIDLVIDYDEEVASQYDSLRREGDRLVVERHVPDLGGRGPTWLWGVAAPLYDEHGHVVGAIEAIRDITEPKKAQNALRQSKEQYKALYRQAKETEELYHSLLDSTLDAIVTYDMEGSVTYVNNGFTKTFGWVKEELAEGVPYVPESEQEKTMRGVMQVIRDGEPLQDFETKRLKKAGGLVDVSLSASRFNDHEGNPAGMLVILRDVTERKRAEQAVIETQERLQLALEAASSDMWESELQTGKYVPAVNLFRRLGYTAPEIPVSWENMWEMVHPDELEEVKCAYLRVVAGKASEMHSDYRMRAESGDWIWCSSFGKVVERDDQGHPLRLVGLTMDVNDQMEAKRQIAEAAELEAVQRGKIQMASSVLHDIGNALTGLDVAVSKLIGEVPWSEIPELARLERMIEQKREAFALALGPGKDEALMEFLAALRKSLEERCQRLQGQQETMSRTLWHIREILDLQRRYVRGGRWGEMGVLDLRELIDDALAMHLGGFEKRGIKVRRNLPSELPSIAGDRTKLIQVLLNIFKNVCEAFDEKEEQEEDRVLDIRVESVKDCTIRLTASDNAIGFDPELTERLFEEGYSTKGRDSGLGLFQCRAIVENHGGSLRLESQGPGKGAHAIIELPAGKGEVQ